MGEAKADAQHHPSKRRAKHAVVMVLGDIGRSPRMQYHTLSLLEEGHYVTLIGYAGERLIPQLEMALSTHSETNETLQPIKPSYHGHLHVLRMEPYQPPKTNIIHRLLYYPLRLISLIYCVLFTLCFELDCVPHTTIPVDVILVQNPPSVPTLWLAYAYCVWQGLWRKHRPRLVIDWHNLGYTMFESPDPQASRSKAFVQRSIRKLAELYERKMAPCADAHLTVTQAMEVWLGENFNVHGEHVRVLYDKPPFMFRPTSVEEQHELFSRLDLEEDQLNTTSKSDDMQQQNQMEQIMDETIFTQSIRNVDGSTCVRLRDDRPALLVSSTSWTPDEDFSILLYALKELHKKIETKSDDDSFPKIIVIVTGKGPQKSHYLPLLKEFNETHPIISIHTIWLEASDYPKLLGCATLGISLHTSTSGLDLPMKVLDMFGCQVPVCAIGFDCLGELVKDGVNGKIFQDGEELANQLFGLLLGYPSDGTLNELEKYRVNIRGMTRWKENWEECARHLIVGTGMTCDRKN
mmetsp:Transcript_14557/g.31648  ORF Transcript_14557/g.31648 Transcript_14557/m.31648 type:complete len:520 (+) Transcript_14557:156-1715(+)|eukprot:CAMPEP_0172300656 /NCGR_PEP_ID=MMETSP1058-20130122/2681_1 /TAXON_ID=83371 /ORGANISM="Detonula confervacea, Strain CCMP 353" /LENGTH=519 /DNA_ID=CAMNT_0013010483 /DNA_START=64 /DNA_END=1623 /DNA_ORIENTATION=+